MNQASRLSASPTARGARADRWTRDTATPTARRFSNGNALLQLRFLQLDADAQLQRVGVADGIEPRTDTRPSSGVRNPSTHSIVVVLPAPLGPIRPKISPSLHVE
jgi:hypothetical protein